MKTDIHFLSYLAHFFRMRSVSEMTVEKIKTHILCSITFFSENRAVYVIMWKNTAELGRPQTSI